MAQEVSGIEVSVRTRSIGEGRALATQAAGEEAARRLGIDPASTVVYSADSRNVALTMVNGRILYENGGLTTLDEEALREEVKVQRRKLFQRAGLA